MMWWGTGSGPGSGWIWMAIPWAIIVAAVVWAVSQVSARVGGQGSGSSRMRATSSTSASLAERSTRMSTGGGGKRSSGDRVAVSSCRDRATGLALHTSAGCVATSRSR
jgi:hypothetical protein